MEVENSNIDILILYMWVGVSFTHTQKCKFKNTYIKKSLQIMIHKC